MSIEREYEAVLQPEPEGGFSVFVPQLPSVATQGETIEETTEMAKEAISAYLQVMREDGLHPDRPPRQRRRPRGVSAKLPALLDAFAEKVAKRNSLSTPSASPRARGVRRAGRR
jgi:antitoxin HicB